MNVFLVRREVGTFNTVIHALRVALRRHKELAHIAHKIFYN